MAVISFLTGVMLIGIAFWQTLRVRDVADAGIPAAVVEDLFAATLNESPSFGADGEFGDRYPDYLIGPRQDDSYNEEGTVSGTVAYMVPGKEFIALYNAVRARRGIPPVSWPLEKEEAAQ